MNATPTQTYGESHPVHIVVSRDLKRSRLTVFFRGLLSFPHLFVLVFWGIAAVIVRFLTWLIGMFTGRLEDGLHNFLARYVRYSSYVTGYRLFVTEPFPPFSGKAGAYAPLDVVIPDAAQQTRLSIFFRPILSIPAVLMLLLWGIWALLVQLVAFFFCLIMGRIAAGMQDQLANYLRYNTETTAYRFRLTDKYPSVSRG